MGKKIYLQTIYQMRKGLLSKNIMYSCYSIGKKKKNPNNQINGQKSEYDVSPKMIYQQPGS